MTEIDLTGAATSQDLPLLLMDRPDFPGYYGCNWNAITGLVAMPRLLRFLGWAGFAARLPDDARWLRECLDEMTATYPDDASLVEYA